MMQIDKKTQPSIMQPMSFHEDILQPDVVGDADYRSISLNNITSDGYEVQDQSSPPRSILLMSPNDNLKISTAERFSKDLRCAEGERIKVISIFGNTGDGKSHTMNHVFFRGQRVFCTSEEQKSCTLGVSAAFQREMSVLCLDTEGLLGTSIDTDQHTRNRMLLKTLAISDIVIYRTRSERLHADMYSFLGSASRAFTKYFADALKSLDLPGSVQKLGPAVIIFHETRHTKPLESTVAESAEDRLRKKFAQLQLDTNAFSSISYVGIRTDSDATTDYKGIIDAISKELSNTTVRSPREPHVIFKAMKALNQKFSGEISVKNTNTFPEEYFSCPVECESCHSHCQRSMGHIVDGKDHCNDQPCNYQHQYENKVYLCKTCLNNGDKIQVKISTQTQNDSSWFGLAKYAWKGPVIECPRCGEIYRARQYWYGNKPPETTAVCSENVHVWKGGSILAKGQPHSAQMVVDGVSYISEALTSISAEPTKALSNWLADKVAPTYWKPNHEITRCFDCKNNFNQSGLRKHHCRGCGEGFCHSCSNNKMPVPARGWEQAVRVCNACCQGLLKQEHSLPESESLNVAHTNSNHNHNIAGGPAAAQNNEGDILVRKYGETIYNTISSVATVAFELPKGFIKDTARPAYWTPDAQAPRCTICHITFGTAEELLIKQPNSNTNEVANTTVGMATATSPQRHNNKKPLTGDCKRHHCRKCGQAVCESCSLTRCPVPERGWQTDVRVCDGCSPENIAQASNENQTNKKED